jgi:hypothetical protein
MLSTNLIETESENNESVIENDIEEETDSLQQIFSPENDQLHFRQVGIKEKLKLLTNIRGDYYY